MMSDTCKRKVLNVLSSVIDTYYVSVDWKGLTHIAKVVDINLVIHTLAKSGYKANLVDVFPSPGYQAMVVDTPSSPTPMYGHHLETNDPTFTVTTTLDHIGISCMPMLMVGEAALMDFKRPGNGNEEAKLSQANNQQLDQNVVLTTSFGEKSLFRRVTIPAKVEDDE
ncbi:hypothetical protein POM88_051911 [Heracleum sosnowskyi]|uniref:Uncharacterized protein n=1 Tax=Heracleum sosnowskyi TaxID=360622 RepID=A0AAD8GT19_9APIA|nr:hypothetical protein POM88_051911 [Heracleum sosnowskyi]